jgi:hypothetical protein
LIGSQFKLQRNVVLEEEKRGDLCCAFVGFVWDLMGDMGMAL